MALDPSSGGCSTNYSIHRIGTFQPFTLQILESNQWTIYNWAQAASFIDHPSFNLAQAYLTAFNGNSFDVERLVKQNSAAIQYALIGAVHGGYLDIVRSFIHRVDYFWLRCAFREACTNTVASPTRTKTLEMFADRVGIRTLETMLIQALECNNYDAVTICLERGATNFTEALQHIRPWTRTHIVQTLLESGAIEWPNFIYIVHLKEHPEFIIQLHKMGTPHYLLVNGYDHIQAVIDQHEAWNTHVKTELGSLGVYSVLADLITQY
jgi:hypothetical protein